MNASKYNSVALFSSLQQNVLKLEISRETYYKWMILSRVLFSDYHRFYGMSQIPTTTENHIRNEKFTITSCSPLFITSTTYPEIRDLDGYTLEVNDSKYTSVQLFSTLRPNLLKMKLYWKSHYKKITTSTVLLTNFHHFDKMP